MKKNILLIVCLLSIVHFNIAQSVTNVRFQQSGKNIKIFYDLQSNDEFACKVEVYCSLDGGKSWGVPLVSVSENVGSPVSPGKNKVIFWDVLNDKTHLIGEIQFKITATSIAYSIKINCNHPDAQVYSENKFLGIASQPIQVGRNELKISVKKDGYITRNKKISVSNPRSMYRIKLKPEKMIGIGYCTGSGTTGGEFTFIRNHAVFTMSIMKIEALTDIDMQSYSSIAFSSLFGLRIPYPYDVSFHIGMGRRIFEEKTDTDIPKNLFTDSFIAGITIPFYVTPKIALYVKTDYWTNTEKNSLLQYSAGIRYKY
jgi:hypothetical protein